jgi:DNA polymerase
VAACRPWLTAEIEAVRSRLLVCMGATAAQSLFGSGFSVMRERGRVLPAPKHSGAD